MASSFNTLLCYFGKPMKRNQILLGRARDESGEPIERFMGRDKIHAKIVPSIESLLIL